MFDWFALAFLKPCVDSNISSVRQIAVHTVSGLLEFEDCLVLTLVEHEDDLLLQPQDFRWPHVSPDLFVTWRLGHDDLTVLGWDNKLLEKFMYQNEMLHKVWPVYKVQSLPEFTTS